MDCNTPVTWENIIRPAIRIIEDGCTAIALDTTVNSNESFGCDQLPLLTRAAMAITDGIVNASYSSSGAIEAHDCTDLPLLPLETLIGYVLDAGTVAGTSVFMLHDSGDAGACGMSCAEAELSTEDLFRRTLISTETPREWVVLVAFVSGNAITCDDTEIPTEQLLRSAFVDLGDGTYAIRVVQEAA